MYYQANAVDHFYPRSPCGERRCFGRIMSVSSGYFYPRSPCGERLPMCIIKPMPLIISIHALLAESDPEKSESLTTYLAFLSTLSLRRATRTAIRITKQHFNFYPRSPCGERRQQPRGTTRTTYFYPRSPCGERQYHHQL